MTIKQLENQIAEKDPPKSLIRHWYFLLHATVWLTGAFIRAAWYFKTRAFSDLAIPHPETLNSKEKRRFQHYFYGTTYLSIVFGALRGRTRSRREKNLFTNLAALAYFFDDLVDAYRDSDQTGILWQNNPELYGQTADPSGLALHFLQNIYNALPPQHADEFKDYMHRVFNVETAGRQMVNWKPNIQELDQITADKGGFSVLMFRRVLENSLSEAEKNALYEFGHLVQLCDDIFDIWFDQRDGIHTLPLELLAQKKLPFLIQTFEQQVITTKSALYNSIARPLNAQQKLGLGHPGAAWGVIHYLVTVTRVCLKHYKNLEKKHGTLSFENRTLLVVDMERWNNRVRAGWLLIFKI
ncbi:MAG: class 1 isoprenoid biosynthesis enzyme [Bacteroidota bacterium]